MKILYIAYSCSPIAGSEDRVGWNIPLEASKRNEVFLITKEEQRKEIEPFMKKSPNNMHIYYVDIPSFYKKIFNGFLYSARLNIWHGKAIPLVKELCEKENIDIVHQVTPMEFRAIGDYGAIKNIKYVCGPLGGGEYVPDALWDYTKGYRTIETLRRIMNVYYRMKYNVTGRFKRCDYYIYANKETRDYVGIGNHVETEMAVDYVLNEVPEKKVSYKCVFLVVGRAIYRKGHRYLFDVLRSLKTDKNFEVRILGDGPDIKYLKSIYDKDEFLQKHVAFVGKIPFTEMKKEYDKAHVLLMPSIRETTGSVLLEAMSNGLPIIAIDKFGSGLLVNESIGWTFGGKTKADYCKSFADAILECINNPGIVRQKGTKMIKESEKYTWIKKVEHFENIYKNLLR